MNAIRVIAALCFSSLIFAADTPMGCCAKGSSGAAMKCGMTQSNTDLRSQLMKMKSELKLSEAQIVKIADALTPQEAAQSCCSKCGKTEGKSGGCCDHSNQSDSPDNK